MELEIAVARPLSGRLREGGGSWRAFSGWIGLAGAIDGVLPSAADAADASEGLPGASRDGAVSGRGAPPAGADDRRPAAPPPA